MTEQQTKLYQLLCAFADLCECRNLRYYLAGGTLLGAVRHRGFIPWDDDVDVMMPEEDYKAFFQHISELPAWVGVISEQTDELYPYYIAKFFDARTQTEPRNRVDLDECHIDIFPLIHSRAPGKAAVFCFNMICVIDYVLQVKGGWTPYAPYKDSLARIGYHVFHILPTQHLRALRHKLVKILTQEQSDYLLSPGGEHKGATEFYPRGWFFEDVSVSFERRKFPAPSGWDAYLKQLYGDYMRLPPIAEQITDTKRMSQDEGKS